MEEEIVYYTPEELGNLLGTGSDFIVESATRESPILWPAIPYAGLVNLIDQEGYARTEPAVFIKGLVQVRDIRFDDEGYNVVLELTPTPATECHKIADLYPAFAKKKALLLPVYDVPYDPQDFVFLKSEAKQFAEKHGLLWPEEAECFEARNAPSSIQRESVDDTLKPKEQGNLLRLIAVLTKMYIKVAQEVLPRSNKGLGSPDEPDPTEIAKRLSLSAQHQETTAGVLEKALAFLKDSSFLPERDENTSSRACLFQAVGALLQAYMEAHQPAARKRFQKGTSISINGLTTEITRYVKLEEIPDSGFSESNLNHTLPKALAASRITAPT